MLTVQTFAAEEEAIALANSTATGSRRIVYTASLGRAERVGRAVRGRDGVGQHVPRARPDGAVRREGESGIGREGGDYALDFYSDLKTLQILEGRREQHGGEAHGRS